jgi:hypothetical protein
VTFDDLRLMVIAARLFAFAGLNYHLAHDARRVAFGQLGLLKLIVVEGLVKVLTCWMRSKR